MDFKITDVGIQGRGKSGVKCEIDNTVKVESNENTFIELSEIKKSIELLANKMELNSNLNPESSGQSIVYGEKLLGIIRWMIDVMLTHTHPPNGIAIPDANINSALSKKRDMEKLILNKNITTK